MSPFPAVLRRPERPRPPPRPESVHQNSSPGPYEAIKAGRATGIAPAAVSRPAGRGGEGGGEGRGRGGGEGGGSGGDGGGGGGGDGGGRSGSDRGWGEGGGGGGGARDAGAWMEAGVTESWDPRPGGAAEAPQGRRQVGLIFLYTGIIGFIIVL